MNRPEARILLVEDDEVLCDILERNLRVHGHAVCTASTMQSALACLRTHDFDLIMLDINLPDQTGWELVREALHEGTLHPYKLDGDKLPVVVLSAARVSPHRMQEFHPLAYLPKPFPMEALLRFATEAAQRRIGETGTEKAGEEETMNSGNGRPNEDTYA